MLIATTNDLPGHRVLKVYGLVRGNTVRTRHVGHDLMARFKNLVGGEVMEYTKMMGECREQSLDRMKAEAEALGANAVIGVRFSTSEMMEAAAELLVYGTAVLVEEI